MGSPATPKSYDPEFWKEMDRKYACNGMNETESAGVYAKWVNSSNYEQDMAKINYQGPANCVAIFHKYASQLGVSKDAKIIDIAAGNGLVSKLLRDHYGYSTFDAVDGCQAMLDDAPQNLFKNKYCSFIGGGHTMPIADETYDAAVAAGAFAESHLKADALYEIFRVLKPGGLLVNSMRKSYIETCDDLKDMPVIFQQLCDDGKIERIGDIVPETKHMADFEGLVHVYRKL